MLAVLLILAVVATASANDRFISACNGRQVQVLSDVDDTIKCPAKATRLVHGGFDHGWTRNHVRGSVLYPGFAAFDAELSKFGLGRTSPHGVVLLSARPKELVAISNKRLTDSTAHKALTEVGSSLSGALYGSVGAIANVGWSRIFRDFADDKVDNFNSFRANTTSSCFLFIGDNGQGDVLAAQRMFLNSPQMAAAFIHVVTREDAGVDDDDDDFPELQPNTVAQENIFYFYNYVGAAVQAHCEGMLSMVQLRLIVSNVRTSLQYESCLKKCEPSPCLFGKCTDSDCQADPDTGYAPACAALLCDLRNADRVISSDITCAAGSGHADASPAYVGDGVQARVCASYDELLKHERAAAVDTALLMQYNYPRQPFDGYDEMLTAAEQEAWREEEQRALAEGGNNDSAGMSPGSIVAIVVCSILLVCIIAVGIYMVRRGQHNVERASMRLSTVMEASTRRDSFRLPPELESKPRRNDSAKRLHANVSSRRRHRGGNPPRRSRQPSRGL